MVYILTFGRRFEIFIRSFKFKRKHTLFTSIATFNPVSIMKITSLLVPTLASLAAASPDFAIESRFEWEVTVTGAAQAASITSAYAAAVKSWQASVTAKPEWTSAYSALVEYQSTGKDVPEGVTATDTILTYTTTPDWYVFPRKS